MRKFIILILILLPSYIFSQNFNGGVLAGMAATQVDGDGLGGYHRAGAIAGFWVSRPLTDAVTIRTELKFIQKGSYQRYTDGAGGTTGDYSLRLNYAEMPFLAEYHFRDDIVPFAGLSLGYLWKWSEKNSGYENPIEQDTKFRKIEFAANAGVEYFITQKFSACAMLSYSILPVRKHTGEIFHLWNLDFGQYNNALQFYVRYHF